jgi:16S rRNA A1518/A1519 N6-dimethyltransferase RsmA/KsgA/DIM1 with predicted DNA glycosylase/AP lyase activity
MSRRTPELRSASAVSICLQMQHALQLVVVEIGGGAGDMTQHVLALGAFADLLEIVVTLVGENVLAQFQHGAVL